MTTGGRLSDFDHPAIQEKAKELTSGKSSVIDKVESIFNYVRDEIQFGFPSKWDQVKASETLQYGPGYCNTKATLFRALCKAINIPARIHTGLIEIKIMSGIFPSFAFPFMPSSGGHSWMEIEVDGDARKAGKVAPQVNQFSNQNLYNGNNSCRSQSKSR